MTDDCRLWLKMFSSNMEPQKAIGNIWHLGFAGWEEGDAGGRHVGEESRLSTGREDATSSMPVARVLPAAQQDIPSINSQLACICIYIQICICPVRTTGYSQRQLSLGGLP